MSPELLITPSVAGCWWVSLSKVLLLNSWVLGGTSSAGFLSKKLTGFKLTLIISHGITGKSSMRGTCESCVSMRRRVMLSLANWPDEDLHG